MNRMLWLYAGFFLQTGLECLYLTAHNLLKQVEYLFCCAAIGAQWQQAFDFSDYQHAKNIKRTAWRRALRAKGSLDLKIVFSSENPNLLGKTLCGSTLDVSASGLRIELNQKIKVDSVLDVWVTLKDSSKKYFLTGNVRWCNEMEVGGHYQIGVVLRERSDTVTDLEAWRQAFKVKQ